MARRLSYILLIPVALFIVTSCSTIGSSGSATDFRATAPLPSLSSNEKAIIELVLAETYAQTRGKKNVIIRDQTYFDIGRILSSTQFDASMKRIMTVSSKSAFFDNTAAKDFRTINATRFDLSKIAFDSRLNIVWYSSIQDKLDGAKDYWQVLDTLVPDNAGIFTFSRAGFSADNKKAMIYVGYQRGPMSGRGTILLLEQKDSGWEVQAVVGTWIS